MSFAKTNITIRVFIQSDLPFVRSLSPILAEQAKLDWHIEGDIQVFQDDYIDEMMLPTHLKNITLIAENDAKQLGFIHARERCDEISGETCATVPLFAVAKNMQGSGVGRLLMKAVEDWATGNNFRLLHLEVFAANVQARNFYEQAGFYEDTLHMIKPLKDIK